MKKLGNGGGVKAPQAVQPAAGGGRRALALLARPFVAAWGVADRVLFGNPAGKAVVLAVLVAVSVPAPLAASLAEPVNQVLDALTDG